MDFAKKPPYNRLQMKKTIFALLFLLWGIPVFATSLNDCANNIRDLFKIPRKGLQIRKWEDRPFSYSTSKPGVQSTEENSLPTIPVDALLEGKWAEQVRQLSPVSPEAPPPPIALANTYTVSLYHQGTPAHFSLFIPVNSEGLPQKGILNQIRRTLKKLPTEVLKNVDVMAVSPWPALHDTASDITFSEALKVPLADSKEGLQINLFPALFKHNGSKKLLSSALKHELGVEDAPEASSALKFLGDSAPSSRTITGFVTIGNIAASCQRGTETITEIEQFHFHSIEEGMITPAIAALAQAAAVTSMFEGLFSSATQRRPIFLASLKALGLQLPVGVGTYYLCRAMARQNYNPTPEERTLKTTCEKGDMAIMTLDGEIRCLKPGSEEAKALIERMK